MNTLDKALMINQNPLIYGTFAEIGAGQEVARFFFQAGMASRTIAKSMSAYDMVFSDEIYGAEKSGRYVSESRLNKMLEREYELLMRRLKQKRTIPTCFFVVANTFTTRVTGKVGDGHGWIGVKFQDHPDHEPSQISLHVRTLDPKIVAQQSAIGTIGVNLLYSAFYLALEPYKMIKSLVDNLEIDLVEIDMIRCSGPVFDGYDNRILSLYLVQENMTDAVMVNPSGEVIQAADALHKKNILALRGSFQPFTLVNREMIKLAREKFLASPGVDENNTMILTEITMQNLCGGEGKVNYQDFVARAEILSALGYHTLISRFKEYYRLADFCRHQSSKKSALVLGASHLSEIFDARYYSDLPGGLMEAFGRLFHSQMVVYVYPTLDETSGKLTTSRNLELGNTNRHLLDYLAQRGQLVDLDGYSENLLPIRARDIHRMIAAGMNGWEKMVPTEVAEIINQRAAFHDV